MELVPLRGDESVRHGIRLVADETVVGLETEENQAQEKQEDKRVCGQAAPQVSRFVVVLSPAEIVHDCASEKQGDQQKGNKSAQQSTQDDNQPHSNKVVCRRYKFGILSRGESSRHKEGVRSQV